MTPLHSWFPVFRSHRANTDIRVAPLRLKRAAAFLLLLMVPLGGCESERRGQSAEVLRLGFFPNLTHAQAIVAWEMSRRGEPWFEPRIGLPVEWFSYNAGPSAMEAILTGSLDATYVGPNPALNAYTRSRGQEIRILAGSARGGAALVVHPRSGISGPDDFRDKRIGTPQFGNTQDVACRYWLRQQGFAVTLTGGEAQVVPTSNPDILLLFRQGRLDAAWTVEPWVSRLEVEAGGRVLVDEEEAITTVLACSARLLRDRPELAAALAAAHRELTEWMVENPEEGQALFQEGFFAQTGSRLPDEVLQRAWGRLRFTHELAQAELEEFVRRAQAVGFLTDSHPLDKLMHGSQ
jgi:NitT/TauT family transport system substrate-binding protein